jgi:hypothetical protein
MFGTFAQGWLLTLYDLPELHFDRLKEGLANACRWRLRIPRLVSWIPSRGNGRRTLWPVSGNQPEPSLPDVESAKETALRCADYPLAHRIFRADVLRRPRKTFLGDGGSVRRVHPGPSHLSVRITLLQLRCSTLEAQELGAKVHVPAVRSNDRR